MMNKFVRNFLCALSLLAVSMRHAADGFLAGGISELQQPVIFPEWEQLTSACQGQRLDISLVIGDRKDNSRACLTMDRLSIELSSAPAKQTPDSSLVRLPGADGPHSNLSSGPRSLIVLKEPSFVGMNGIEYVPCEHGCWELVWKKGDIAGNLICGFQLPKKVQRNAHGTHLNPGSRVYVSFLVWREDEMTEHRTNTIHSQEEAEAFFALQEDEIAKMDKAASPWNKAKHWRRALAAREAYQAHADNYDYCWSVTPRPEDLVDLNAGIFLMRKGTIWKNGDAFFGDELVFVGEAFLKTGY